MIFRNPVHWGMETPVNMHLQTVFSLLQDDLTAAAMRRLRALDEKAWGEVVSASEALLVAPVLLGRAEKLNLELPLPIRSRLLEIVRTHTARNLRLLQEFQVIASVLQEQSVDFMPIKGVHLCTSLYANIVPGLRRTRATVDNLRGPSPPSSSPQRRPLRTTHSLVGFFVAPSCW